MEPARTPPLIKLNFSF